MSTFHDMLFELGGSPVSGGRYSNPFSTHWFVDGNTGYGDDGNDGKTPDRAKATVDAAVQLMGVGDVLYVRPLTYVVGTGHGRYTECATIDLAQSDLTIIGTGYSRSNEFGVRMKATSTQVYCIDSSAPSLHLENIGFFSDGTATNTIILRANGATNTQRNDGSVLYHCHFKDAPTAIQGGQAQRVIDCVFQTIAAGGHLALGTPSSSSYNVQVRGCSFLDSSTTAPTVPQINDGGGGAYCLWIDHCYFGKIPTTTAYYITISGANSSGMITNSFFNTSNLDTDTDISIASSNFMLVGCWDKTGLIDATDD